MAEARGRFHWSQTAEILSMLFNANRDPKKTAPKTPVDFNPYPPEKDEKRPLVKTKDLSILKTVFVDNWPGRRKAKGDK